MKTNDDTKIIKTEVLLSMTTGVLLCDFDELHEAIEFVLGHPVWTHELGDKATVDRIRDVVLSQFPEMGIEPLKQDEGRDWKKYTARHKAILGESREVKRGTKRRTEGPVSSLLRMKPNANVVAAVVPTDPTDKSEE